MKTAPGPTLQYSPAVSHTWQAKKTLMPMTGAMAAGIVDREGHEQDAMTDAQMAATADSMGMPEDARVHHDDDNAGHGHERGDAGENLGPDRAFLFPDMDNALHGAFPVRGLFAHVLHARDFRQSRIFDRACQSLSLNQFGRPEQGMEKPVRAHAARRVHVDSTLMIGGQKGPGTWPQRRSERTLFRWT